MAYHEVTEYSSPTVSILPAPLHASLLGLAIPGTSDTKHEIPSQNSSTREETTSASDASIAIIASPAPTSDKVPESDPDPKPTDFDLNKKT